MKYLSLGLFIAYLLLISVKSFIQVVSPVELGVLFCLFLMVVCEKAYKLHCRTKYREYLLEKERIELQRPEKEDEEVLTLRKDNEVEALKLRKFMTQQEYNKREISRAMDQEVGQSGIRF